MTVAKKNRGKVLNQFNYWRSDWNAFVSDCFGVTLDKEQQEILSAVQHNSRITVSSGTSRGKDFVAACAALCFFNLTPRWNKKKELIENTKVILTAPTDRQIKNIMMPEISRLVRKAENRGIELPGRITISDIRTENKEWFLTGFKADENNREAWSGLHAVHIMFVITEATGISDNIFETIEGNLQGDSKILLVYNPNISTGYAAKSQKSDDWKKFRLNSLNAVNVTEKKDIIPGQVDYKWVKSRLEEWCTKINEDEVQVELDDFKFEGQWYRPEDLFRTKVLGKFPKVSEDVLIPPQWIEAAQQRWREYKGNQVAAACMLGVDVAGMGRDSTVYCNRQGSRVHYINKRNSGGVADHMRVAGDVVNFLNSHKKSIAMIDTIGEGAGVISRLVEQGYANNNNAVLFDKGQKGVAISCKYSEAAKDSKGNNLTDITGQYNFANMRAYLFWCVRDWLNPKNETGAMLPTGGTLAQEVAEIKWNFRSDGKIIIEPKEDIKHRLGYSPDEFDALANTFYPVRVRVPFDTSNLRKIAY